MAKYPNTKLLGAIILIACLSSQGQAMDQGANPKTEHILQIAGTSIHRLSDGTNARAPNSQMNGPKLVQFWASWCQRCSGLFAKLESVSKRYGLSHIAVSIDEEASAAKNYLKKFAPKDTTIIFAHDFSNGLSQKFAVASVPEIVILNAENQILLKKIGHLSSGDLLDIHNALRTHLTRPKSH